MFDISVTKLQILIMPDFMIIKNKVQRITFQIAIFNIYKILSWEIKVCIKNSTPFIFNYYACKY